MRCLLLALALLVLAPSAQAFDLSRTTWANKRGSMMDIVLYGLPPYNFWSGAYSSNELTTPQQCRNKLKVLSADTTPSPSANWGFGFPANVQRMFYVEIRAEPLPQHKADCPEETVWEARIVYKPLRLCTIWMKKLPSGQVIQGADVFWSIPFGSFAATDGPYLWPPGHPVKSSACWLLTKRKNGAIPRAPKNYPVWPPIPDPGPLRR